MTGVVADTSPLVALHQISLLHILPTLLGRVLIPEAVFKEALSVKLEPWIEVKPLQGPIAGTIRSANIGLGETEAISLAVEIGATRLIVDDLQARRLATSLGLPVIGTTGLLLAAKRRGLILSVREPLGALLDLGFRLHPDVHRAALMSAGEVVS